MLHDLHESAMVIAAKPASSADSGTLWVSGSSGREWSPLLKKVHYPDGGPADVVMVDGLAGIYLVNQVL